MRFIIGLVISLAFAFGCGAVAKSKGRGQTLWAILGFFFWIIPLIVVAILPRKTG